MTPILVATAVTVVAGAIVGVSSREARIALLGLAVSLVGAPLLVDPLPNPLSLAARLVAAILAVELLWIAVRATSARTRGSLVGWPVEALAAVAAFIVGYVVGLATGDAGAGTASAGSSAEGTALILGASFSLLALAVTPLALGRDVLRLGIAATLLVTGATTIRAALAGSPTPLEELVIAGVTVGLGVAAAVACANAFAARSDFSLGGIRPREPSPGRVARPQAHPRLDDQP